jgi:hypothetical protein
MTTLEKEYQIMTPAHPDWIQFYKRLAGPEACNIREEAGQTVWTCGHDNKGAEAILRSMPFVDVPGTLSHFAEHGATCDCTILFEM